MCITKLGNKNVILLDSLDDEAPNEFDSTCSSKVNNAEDKCSDNLGIEENTSVDILDDKAPKTEGSNCSNDNVNNAETSPNNILNISSMESGNNNGHMQYGVEIDSLDFNENAASMPMDFSNSAVSVPKQTFRWYANTYDMFI